MSGLDGGKKSSRKRKSLAHSMTGYMLRPGSPDGREERLAPAEDEYIGPIRAARPARFASGDVDGVSLMAFPSACELVEKEREAEIRTDSL